MGLAFSVGGGRVVPASCLEQLGSPRLRATGQLTGLGVSSDGADIVAATDERALVIFSAGTGERRLVVRAPDRSLSCLHVAGRRALWGCHGQGAHVVDLDDGRVIRTLPHADVRRVALSADGRLAVTGGDRTVKQWDVATGKERKKLGGHRSLVSQAAFLSAGEALTAGGDGVIKVHDLATGKSRKIGPPGTNYASQLRASPATSRVVWSWGPRFRCWDTSRDALSLDLARQEPTLLDGSPDGRTALVAGEETLSLLDLADGAPIWSVPYRFPPRWAAFFPDGQRFVCAAHDVGWLSGGVALEIRDAGTGAILVGPEGHFATVEGVASVREGVIVSASRDGTLRRWRNGTELARLEAPFPLDALTLHPGGKAAVVTRQYGKGVAVIDLAGKTGPAVLPRTETCKALAFSPDGASLALAAGTRVDVLAFPSLAEVIRLEKHRYQIESLAWSADGRRVASGGEDGDARVYDVASGDVLLVARGEQGMFVQAVALSADGALLFSAVSNQVSVWDVASGRRLVRADAWGSVAALRAHESGAVLAACEVHASGAPGTVGLLRWGTDGLSLGEHAELPDGDQPLAITQGEDELTALCGTEHGYVLRLRLA